MVATPLQQETPLKSPLEKGGHSKWGVAGWCGGLALLIERDQFVLVSLYVVAADFQKL